MHKEACAIIPRKNVAKFKLLFSTKYHSHCGEPQLKEPYRNEKKKKILNPLN